MYTADDYEITNFDQKNKEYTLSLEKGSYIIYVLGMATPTRHHFRVLLGSQNLDIELSSLCQETCVSIVLQEDTSVLAYLNSSTLRVLIKKQKTHTDLQIPKILTVVPIKNCEAYIERCLTSLNLQTLKPTMICVIDDNSSDSSVETVQKFESTIPIHLYTNNISIGPYLCKNFAVNELKDGFDIITFLDSDDFILHETYELLLEALQSSDSASGVYPSFVRIEKGHVRAFPPLTESGSTSRKCFAGLFAYTSLFDAFGYFDAIRFGADGEFDSRCTNLNFASTVHLDSTLYFAELRSDSLTQTEKVSIDDTASPISWLSPERYEYSQRFSSAKKIKAPFNIPENIPHRMLIFRRVTIVLNGQISVYDFDTDVQIPSLYIHVDSYECIPELIWKIIQKCQIGNVYYLSEFRYGLLYGWVQRTT